MTNPFDMRDNTTVEDVGSFAMEKQDSSSAEESGSFYREDEDSGGLY